MRFCLLGVLSLTLMGGGMAAHAAQTDPGDSFDSHVQGRAFYAAISAAVRVSPPALGEPDAVVNALAVVEVQSTPATTAVPESETWALMLAGVLAVGWMHARRRP